MGQVASSVIRIVQRFNVENRAHKLLERDKPVAAPKYESNIRDMERTLELDPKFIDNLNKKDDDLDKRLKSVYVTSQNIIIKRESDKKKPMPKERTTPEDFEFGFLEPKQPLIGHCTLRQAMEFITNHQSDPKEWTAQKIANDYKMKTDLIENVLQYFKSYNIYIPDIKKKPSFLAEMKGKLLESTGSKSNTNT